ncbi:AbfB domain-containing protein [Catellatospora sichuanensis]|uniref:AbfB domain-containing protein n=1 Tax=Catellatospora sichuanensis TaxID=1969805 RepID=UPI001C91D34F|nr:AbfB domain-containing protein [Catellatospora sichuanensis]
MTADLTAPGPPTRRSASLRVTTAGHTTNYLRHAGFRVRKDARDGTALFDADATCCAQPDRSGTGNVSLASSNLPSLSVRHYAAEVWVADNGGPHAYDSPTNHAPDTTWAVDALAVSPPLAEPST